VGTQRPKKLREQVAKVLGIPLEKVVVHPLRMGGAFGRKTQTDFVIECVLIAKKMGRPVKLLWLREDDIQFDFFRPASYQKLRAEFKKTGEIVRWAHTCVMPMRETSAHNESVLLEPTQKDLQQGATDFLLNTQSMQFYAKGVASDVRIGIWRSVNHSFFAHAINCFVDDIAQACQEHPLDYRLKHLKTPSVSHRIQSIWQPQPSITDRMRLVLENMKEEAKPLYSAAANTLEPQKSAIGFAAHHAFGAVIAIAVKIRVENKQISIEQIHVVVDAGFIVNPIQALSQIEGGVYFALGAALFGEILIDKGRVQNRNFHDTPILPRYLAPPVTVTWLGQEGAPQGLGEVAVPVVSPALCNAIFAATGQRVTRLPLSHHFTFKIGLT
jgi:isoquinoline 1-oxidoreductase subunit beta